MDFIKWLIGGFVGAVIGGAVWVAVGYFMEAEVGYIAWGIGLLAGIGVRVLAGNDVGVMPGIAGVIAAVGVVLGAKYMVVSMQVNAVLAEGSPEIFSVSDEDMQVSLAFEMAAELEEEGKTLQWPAGMSLENAETGSHFPPGVWKASQEKWNALPADERESQKQAQIELQRQFASMFSDTIKEAGFRESFNGFDLLWFGLAAFTAFRVGSGYAGDD